MQKKKAKESIELNSARVATGKENQDSIFLITNSRLVWYLLLLITDPHFLVAIQDYQEGSTTIQNHKIETKGNPSKVH